jgi:hypothetical protein
MARSTVHGAPRTRNLTVAEIVIEGMWERRNAALRTVTPS